MNKEDKKKTLNKYIKVRILINRILNYPLYRKDPLIEDVLYELKNISEFFVILLGKEYIREQENSEYKKTQIVEKKNIELTKDEKRERRQERYYKKWIERDNDETNYDEILD